MAPSETAIRLYGFAGLNTELRADLIDDRELVEAENVLIEPSGEIIARDGLEAVPIVTSGGAITGTRAFIYSNTTDRVYVGVGGWNVHTLYKKEFTDLHDSGVDWTEVPLSSNTQFALTAPQITIGANSTIEMFFGRNGARVHYHDAFNGSFELANSPQDVDALEFHKERLFASRIDTLWFSDPGAFETWPSTNFIKIGSDSNTVFHLVSYNDQLIIFTKEGIWRLAAQGDPADWVLEQVTDQYRAQTKFCVLHVENVLYFLDPHVGLVATDLVSFETLSDAIWDSFYDKQTQDAGLSDFALSRLSDEHFLLTLPYSLDLALPEYLIDNYVFNFKSNAWTKISTQLVTAGGATRSLSTSELRNRATSDDISRNALVGSMNFSATGGAVIFEYRPQATDNHAGNGESLPIAVTVKTKTFIHQLPEKFKRVKWLAIDGKVDAGDITVTYEVNDTEQAAITIDKPNSYKTHKVRGPGYAKKYAVKISSDDGAGFSLVGMTHILHQKRSVVGSAT